MPGANRSAGLGSRVGGLELVRKFVGSSAFRLPQTRNTLKRGLRTGAAFLAVEIRREMDYGKGEMKGAMNGPEHILVAEDNATDAFFLQRAFSRGGMPVTLHFARDGQEVIDYLQGLGAFADRVAHPLPRLLLLDLNLPRLSGFEVLSWIRDQPALHDLQVVIFTGSNEPKDVRRAFGLGANSYWVKPHSIEELNALVGRFKTAWGEPRSKNRKPEAVVNSLKH